LSAPLDPLAAIGEGAYFYGGRKGREWEKGRKGMAREKGGRGGEGGKGRNPVLDCESAKVATLKVWGSANYAWGE